MRLLTSLARADAGGATSGRSGREMGIRTGAALIGYLDQDPRFHGWMRGRELLELVGNLYGMRGAELRQRIDETLALVGLAEAARRPIGGYSGGMRQRLGLAQAVLNRPPVLLLDEPVSARSIRRAGATCSGHPELGGSSTVLFSTHILNDVERVCDRVAIIDRGRLVTEGPWTISSSATPSRSTCSRPSPVREEAMGRLGGRDPRRAVGRRRGAQPRRPSGRRG